MHHFCSKSKAWSGLEKVEQMKFESDLVFEMYTELHCVFFLIPKVTIKLKTLSKVSRGGKVA